MKTIGCFRRINRTDSVGCSGRAEGFMMMISFIIREVISCQILFDCIFLKIDTMLSLFSFLYAALSPLPSSLPRSFPPVMYILRFISHLFWMSRSESISDDRIWERRSRRSDAGIEFFWVGRGADMVYDSRGYRHHRHRFRVWEHSRISLCNHAVSHWRYDSCTRWEGRIVWKTREETMRNRKHDTAIHSLYQLHAVRVKMMCQSTIDR